MTGDTVLLIGLDTTKKYEGQIREPERLSTLKAEYGEESVFAEPYRILTEQFAAESVSVLNLDAWDDLREDPELFEQHDYTYIIPLGLRLSDSYDDIFENKRYLYSQLLVWMTDRSNSVVVLSGIHASSYNTLTEYLAHEKSELDTARTYFYNLRGNNCIYVSNSLRRWPAANVILAGLLLDNVAEYPVPEDLGEAYFDIDASDIDMDLVWFQNHHLRPTTVENLKNFAENSLLKNVLVDRAIRYIKRHWPDIHAYIGTAFTQYKMTKIAEQAETYLKTLKHWIIRDYKILSVTSVQNPDSTVNIHVHYEIWPIFTTERYVDEVIL